jgi:hypothetical protein
MYYRNANCAVVVYDITQAVRTSWVLCFGRTDIRQASLDKAKAWVKELQRQANENIIIALAGNKLDLVTESPDKRAITTADEEAAHRPGRPAEPKARTATTGRQPEAGGEPNAGPWRVQLLDGGAWLYDCRYRADMAAIARMSQTTTMSPSLSMFHLASVSMFILGHIGFWSKVYFVASPTECVQETDIWGHLNL